MRQPHQPALLMFEAYSWALFHGTFNGTSNPGSGPEDKHTHIAEYYGNIQVGGQILACAAGWDGVCSRLVQ